MSARAFRASVAANKASNQKPSIGDAVTILQSKVSGINQVVSSVFYLNGAGGVPKLENKH